MVRDEAACIVTGPDLLRNGARPVRSPPKRDMKRKQLEEAIARASYAPANPSFGAYSARRFKARRAKASR
ncbi:MAG TPA: hypothetical protein VGP22_04975 [Albitalea sp.]|nr:hypothetical protein [Albitalea sp.]